MTEKKMEKKSTGVAKCKEKLKKVSRGPAKCKKKLLNPDKCKVDFDAHGRAINDKGQFMSFIGMECRKRIPYNKKASEVDPKLYEDVWEFAKETWKIPNDVGKKVTIKKAKKIMRGFRSTLRKKYVYKDESIDNDKDEDKDEDKNEDDSEDEDKGPFGTYKYLDPNLWESFVKATENEDWKEKSQKAQHNKKQNHEPSKVGRGGYAGLEPHVESRWSQLVSTYPFLNAIQDEHSKLLMISKASYNKVTKKYELDEELVSKDKLTGLLEEPQKTKKNKRDVVELAVGESLNSYTEILSIQQCQLLLPDKEGAPKVVGMGRVHPNPENIIHNSPMKDGFVKVQVDRVVEGCGSTRLLPESCVLDEIEYMEDAKGGFIQWPVKLIKILNKISHQSVEPSHHSTSTLYRPQFEATFTHPHQTILDERNEFQIYSNALQDEEAFNQLFSDNTMEHVPLYKPIEPVHDANHPIKPVNDANQPTKLVVSERSKDKTKIDSLLKKARLSSPQSIYILAQQVAIQAEKSLFVACTTPQGMHETPLEEIVEFEAVLQLCVNGWADVCFVHWFTMYLYGASRQEGLNNTVYFNPRYIEDDLVSDDEDFVFEHIKDVISFHKDKQWFMAPHVVRGHWVLILLQHNPTLKTREGHIFDSLKGLKDHSYYRITKLFEKAIEPKITWNMVECPQQPNGWECGYIVMMNMYDFVFIKREHMMLNKKRMVRPNEIREFVERTLKVFISSIGDPKDVEDDE